MMEIDGKKNEMFNIKIQSLREDGARVSIQGFNMGIGEGDRL